MQDIKRKTAQENNFIAVAPCNWMANMALNSDMFDASPLVIPYGVNIELFNPMDKFTVRRKLGLPVDRYIILILASYLGEERKGTKYALQALAGIKDLAPYLLIIGHGDHHLAQELDGFEYLMTGYLKDDQKKAEYLAAADLFLSCSLADNMPLTILETMAVATPMVGFATGGIPEMVQHDHSGYLARPKDIEGLDQGLRLGLIGKQAPLWGERAREKVEQSFSHSIFLRNHLELYEKAITDFKGS
jgi:glycosyltransferase involved in cell wall biosynthesis